MSLIASTIVTLSMPLSSTAMSRKAMRALPRGRGSESTAKAEAAISARRCASRRARSSGSVREKSVVSKPLARCTRGTSGGTICATGRSCLRFSNSAMTLSSKAGQNRHGPIVFRVPCARCLTPRGRGPGAGHAIRPKQLSSRIAAPRHLLKRRPSDRIMLGRPVAAMSWGRGSCEKPRRRKPRELSRGK